MNGRRVVRLVDQDRQLMVGQGDVLDCRGRVVAASASIATVRVGWLKIEIQ